MKTALELAQLQINDCCWEVNNVLECDDYLLRQRFKELYTSQKLFYEMGQKYTDVPFEVKLSDYTTEYIRSIESGEWKNNIVLSNIGDSNTIING